MLLMDYASAAAQAGDEERLHAIAASAPRLDAARQEIFRMLTEAPIRTVNDLPRAARELVADRQALAQGLSATPR
jgi:hypothetical protein